MNFKDLTGQKFNRLTAIKYLGESKWLCKCDCGKETVVLSSCLKTNHTKSCGCLKLEKTRQMGQNFGKLTGIKNRKYKNLSYSKDQSKIYGSWNKMIQRCKNKNDIHYGGRGITVCQEWLNFENFYYWSIDNGYKIGLTIDRINNNGNYEPNNCRWTTRKEQNRNKSDNIKLTYNNKTFCLMDWSKLTGLNYSCLRKRYQKGWDIEKMLTTPSKNYM